MTADPRFTFHPGKFRTHPKSMPLVTPRDGVATAMVVRTEEKQSDVNLGTMLLVDGMDGLYDEAIVICNDSDLTMPIKVANERFGPVHVVRPTREHLNDLNAIAASYNPLPGDLLSRAQLADSVRLRNGKTVTRPLEWSSELRET